MLAQVASAVVARPGPAIRRGLDREAGSHLTAIGSLQHKHPGETVFMEGDDAHSIYEVVQGTLRLYKLLPDGRRQITGFMSRGHLLGLAPEGVCVYSAEAITDVTLRRYARAAFERLIDKVPGFARLLLTAASHELCTAQDQMLLLGRKTAMEKVASFLLRIADQQEVDDVHLPMTRNDIADYLGLTIETVSRTLTKLKDKRLIALPTPARLVIRDRDRLEELAAGGTDTDP
jgi:CRP/FNR family transcriptional regulator